jgi:peptidoglycan/LPS O-acetylase OafA/YrhL
VRNKRLDILRCIAVLLVIIHHGNISSFFARVGWTGVDLFFVLSGFLISGLLFSEYKKRGSISFKRFFIRRGLKIYPAFYVFLLVTVLFSLIVLHVGTSTARLMHEMFFVQNYWYGVWDHTWTLGIEEQFYIFLPVLLLLLMRISSNQQEPFLALPWIILLAALLCMVSRATSVYWGIPNYHRAYTATHDRIDSLFFGVLLGYLYHFRPHVLELMTRSTMNRLAIIGVSVLSLSSAYFLPRDTKVFSVFGFSLLYVGYGGVLLLSLYVRGFLPANLTKLVEKIGDCFAYVGKYSYSIYLWHGPTNAWFPGLIRRILHFPTGHYGRFAVYLVGSLVIGITMSKLIEYPVLRLRDKLFPQGQIVAVAPEV